MYIKIKKEITETFIDYPDNSIIPAILVFCVGCLHNCQNCQNKSLQDLNYTDNSIIQVNNIKFSQLITHYTKLFNTKKIVLTGGDPFCVINNLHFMTDWIIKNYHKYNICVYTGYTFDEIKNVVPPGIKYLKTGRYNETVKNENPGKTDNAFTLVSKNQEFWCWNVDKYNKISNVGIMSLN